MVEEKVCFEMGIYQLTFIRKEEYLQLRMLLGSFVLRVEKKPLEQGFTIRAELESSMQLGH